MSKEVLVCQLHRFLFRNNKYCSRKCDGYDCRYLQSFEENRIKELLDKGYGWFKGL